jgi:rhodanese-related sulfurtransferase
MRRTFLRAVVILLTGTVAGLVVNLGSPYGIPVRTPARGALPTEQVVPLTEARQLLGAALFLDARRAEDYALGHIAGAFNLPADDFDAQYPQVAGLLSPTGPVVVYCDGVDCDLSHRVRERLAALGYPQTRVLVNGWTVWRAAGLPTTTGVTP